MDKLVAMFRIAIASAGACFLAACADCPFYEHGQIVTREEMPRDRVVSVLSDALKAINFKARTCGVSGGVNRDCDFLFYQPAPWPLNGVGVDHVQVRLHVDTLTVSLVDANRSETPLARKVTEAIQAAVRANLGGEINFDKEKVAHSCVFGP